MFDETDVQIIKLLTKNSRSQWREIGEEVHLTGQAVKNRISRLEKLGVIEGYTIKVNSEKLGKKIIAYITVFMKNTEHAAFQKYVQNNTLITEANKISGEGCYMLKAVAAEQEEIAALLDEILKYGNYKINISIGVVK